MVTKPGETALAVASATTIAEPVTAFQGSSEPNANIRTFCSNQLMYSKLITNERTKRHLKNNMYIIALRIIVEGKIEFRKRERGWY